MKQWIGSERSITICAMVKTWLRQYDVTVRQRPVREGSHIVYITEKVAHQYVQIATLVLFAAARGFRETCRLRIRLIDIRDFTYLDRAIEKEMYTSGDQNLSKLIQLIVCTT